MPKRDRDKKKDPLTVEIKEKDVTDWRIGKWHGVDVPDAVRAHVNSIVNVALNVKELPQSNDRDSCLRHLQCAVEYIVYAADPDFTKKVEDFLGRKLTQRVHR